MKTLEKDSKELLNDINSFLKIRSSIDELDKSTLQSYWKKADSDANKRDADETAQAKVHYDKMYDDNKKGIKPPTDDSEFEKKMSKKRDKVDSRRAGVDTALSKIVHHDYTKESVEELDEDKSSIINGHIYTADRHSGVYSPAMKAFSKNSGKISSEEERDKLKKELEPRMNNRNLPYREKRLLKAFHSYVSDVDINESIISIDELKASTLGSYIKTASDDKDSKWGDFQRYNVGRDSEEVGKRGFNKSKQRGAGIRTAVDKLIKGDYQKNSHLLYKKKQLPSGVNEDKYPNYPKKWLHKYSAVISSPKNNEPEKPLDFEHYGYENNPAGDKKDMIKYLKKAGYIVHKLDHKGVRNVSEEIEESFQHFIGSYHKDGKKHYLWQDGHYSYHLTDTQDSGGRFNKIKQFSNDSLSDVHKKLKNYGYSGADIKEDIDESKSPGEKYWAKKAKALAKEKPNLRLIQTHVNGDKTAKVYKNKDHGEYQVKFHTGDVYHKDNDYFSDDKNDAHTTAKSWIKSKNENYEQLDELKRSTLSSYLKKAWDDRDINNKDYDRRRNSGIMGKAGAEEFRLKHLRRSKGITNSVDRLESIKNKSGYQNESITESVISSHSKAKRAANAILREYNGQLPNNPSELESFDKKVSNIATKFGVDVNSVINHIQSLTQ